MTSSNTILIATGDRAPNIIAITAKGTLYATDEQSGRAVVLILSGTLDAPELIPLLDAFTARAEAFADKDADLVAMIDTHVENVFEFNFTHPGKVTLVGSPNEFPQRIGFTGAAPEILVLDTNQRVAAHIPSAAPEAMVAASLEAIDRLPREEPRNLFTSAPVLMLPNILDLDLCRELVDMHHAGASFQSPALYLDASGRPVNDTDFQLKKRRDFLISRAHPMHHRLTDIVRRVVFPEIKRCFQAEVRHTERFNVACYPGDGGHFRRHRDNRPEIVAFRRFALSINLTPKADGYEGGFLRLPEFNGHHYRSPTGGGVIFSVDLLHEIAPVVSGNRFVLVNHLFDDEAVAKRMEMEQL